MKKRNVMILAILLVIGFAAVSTTLILNGTVNLAFNTKDFDVYFSAAMLNGEDKKSEFISSDGKELNFNTNTLSMVGDQAIVYYEVTNASRYYDAEVKLVCDDLNDEHVSVTNVLNADVIESQTTADGVFVSELISASVDSKSINLTCRIEATPVSREKEGEEIVEGDVTTYSLYGYYVDEDNNSIANADLVVYSDTPHFVKTDARGYFYVEGLEKGSHEIYYLKNADDLESKTKDEIKSLATSSSVFTTSSGNVVFSDNSQIKDVVIELTNNAQYNIVLKTSSGAVINENYLVIQNHTYGNLPTVEVTNSSFIHWELEDGTVVNNDTLVVSNKPHELIAVISPVVSPVIQANASNWTTNDVTVSIKTPGVAEKGIKHYEYLITKKENPSSQDSPNGTTSGNITVSNIGTNYVYYRTVANDDVKSSWSEGIVTKIDKTAPTDVSFSNKVITSDNVTMNVNYTENESNITSTKCYYGDASSQTKEGSSNNGTCVYPSSSEYAKVCVVNSVGKETCSSPKKLADYFIKDGKMLEEFLEYTPDYGTLTTAQKDGYYQIEVGDKNAPSGRGGIYTKNKYDFSIYEWGYYDLDIKQEGRLGAAGPHVESTISNYIWFKGSTEKYQSIFWLGDFENDPGSTSYNPRQVQSGRISFSPRNDVYISLGKNSSTQYATIKIYNVWFQLQN